MARNHYNWKIFNAAAIVASLSLVAKVVSAIKDLVIAAWFGSGENVDAFILGALLPLLSVSVFSAPFSSSLIPLVTRRIVQGDQAGAFCLFEKHTLRLMAALIFLTIIFFISADCLALVLTPDRGTLVSKTALTLKVTSILVFVSGLGQNLIMVLNALEIFALPAISQIVSPITMIIALAWCPQEQLAYALPFGAVLGNTLQLGILTICYLRHRKTAALKVAAELIDQSPWQQWFPLFLSALLMSSTDIVDQIMAAQLGSGQVAILGYGFKVTSLLVSIIAGALASAAFPYLSQMIERGESSHLYHTLRTYTQLILLGSSLVVAVMILFSYEITQLLFERGNFTAIDSIRVAFVQQLAVLQLPFYLLNILYMRVIMAQRISGYLSLVTLVSIILNIVLNIAFSRSYGVAGIALSTSCVYLWSAAALGVVIIRTKNSVQR